MTWDSLALAGVALAIAPPSVAQTVAPGTDAVWGLAGTVDKVDAPSTRHHVADTLAPLATAKPIGTLTAPALADGGGDGARTIRFLRPDGLSYRGASNAVDPGDGIIQLTGDLHVPAAGSYASASDHDHAVPLTIGGETIRSAGCCGLTSGTAAVANAGLYGVDLLYPDTRNGGGAGNAYVTLTTNAVVSFAQSMSAPVSWAMMIIGMGAIGFALRRQTVDTRVSYAD